MRAIAGATFGLALVLLSPTVAGAAAPCPPDEPLVTVRPATDLPDRARIQVSGTGLTPNTVFHVGQCGYVEGDVLACNIDVAREVTTNARGAARVSVVVQRTFEGKIGAEHEPWGTVDCGVVTCFVGMVSQAGEGSAEVITFRSAGTTA